MHHFLACLIAAFMLCLLINWLELWGSLKATGGDLELIVEFISPFSLWQQLKQIEMMWISIEMGASFLFLLIFSPTPSCSES